VSATTVRRRWPALLHRAAPFGAGALVAFSAAAVGAGLGRALVTTYLPVLLSRIRDAPELIGMVMLVNTFAGFAVPLLAGMWSDRLRTRRWPIRDGPGARRRRRVDARRDHRARLHRRIGRQPRLRGALMPAPESVVASAGCGKPAAADDLLPMCTPPRGGSIVDVPPVLSAVELTKHFDDVTAVIDLSFDVDAGSVTGFLGPNGAGKTTTLRMLLGLAQPTHGRALVFGRPFAELDRPATRVGAVLEAADLHPGRTGRDHLRILALAARVPRSRVEQVLALADLTGAADRRVAGYSLGMRQRLSLAAALLGDPELLILDEPANGLDPEGVRWLRDFLRAYAAEGRTVLVSSHHLAEVAQTVDQVVIISRGRLVVEAPLSEVTTRLAGTVRVEAARPDALELALRDAGIAATQRENGTLRVHGVTADRIGEIALAADVAVRQLVTESSSLEDVFLELTAEPPS
jgi:ABC-2 type transport system ATP-binding protein